MKKRVNFLHFLWIAFCSFAATIFHCCRALAAAGRPDMRARVDVIAREWSQGLVDRIDLRWKTVGSMPTLQPDRRYIVMCTHSSHYDIPVSFLALSGSLRMLAKKELSRIPVFGRAMANAEFIFIDRHNREQALRDLAKARAMMESGIVLWVAPEGTRSVDGKLLPFKKGGFHLALETGALIIPVAIRGIADVLPKGSMNLNKHVSCEVHIGEPIDAALYSMESRGALMQAVQRSMRTMLGEL